MITKENFSVKSILLTTLIGNSVYASDEGGEDFKDIPTALKTVSNRINSFLQANVLMPEICNPVLDGESFTRHWDQDKYSHFREMFDLYNGKINEAFEETDHNASVRKWRELFGDNFGELKDDTENTAGVSVAVAFRVEQALPPKSHTHVNFYYEDNLIVTLEWLRSNFPNLYYEANSQKILGELDFCAVYDQRIRKNNDCQSCRRKRLFDPGCF